MLTTWVVKFKTHSERAGSQELFSLIQVVTRVNNLTNGLCACWNVALSTSQLLKALTHHVGGEVEVGDVTHGCAHEVGIQHTLHGEMTDLRIQFITHNTERGRGREI